MKPLIAPAIAPVDTTRANRLAGLFEPATVVLFAGLGGVCIGIEQAYIEGGYKDKYIDLAVNHWETAVAVHQLNHPMTEHLHCDVWEVDPNAVLPGRKIAYLHLSPDCTDFSKAKGGAPKRKHIRALADVGLVWAGKRRPDVFTLENVEEFKQWGPLLKNGQPDPKKRGTEFDRWVKELQALGYVVEWRELRACDYGTPTTRKRLFVIARCDGKPIVWPEKTHGSGSALQREQHPDDRDGVARREVEGNFRRLTRPQGDVQRNDAGLHATGDTKDCGSAGANATAFRRGNEPSKHRALQPFRTAAECIDWSQPMLSIFAKRPEARAWTKSINVGREKHERVGVPQRPLRPKTQHRLAGGLDKWVLKAIEPFIVNIANYGWNSSPTESVSTPLSTVTSGPRGGKHAAVDVGLAASYAGTFNHGGDEHRTNDLRQPIGTITGANEARGLVGATLSSFTVPRYGERKGQAPRSGSVESPLPTVVPKGNGAQLVAVALNKHFGGVIGQAADVPLGTVTGVDHNSLLAVSLSQDNHTDPGSSAADPLRTITGVVHSGLMVVHLANYHGEKGDEVRGQNPGEPLRTLDTQNRYAPVAARIAPITCGAGGAGYAGKPRPLDKALNTVMVNDRQALAAAHVMKFRGDSVGSSCDQPMPTVTSGAGSARDAGAAHTLGIGAVYLSHMYSSSAVGGQGDPGKPLKTITGGGQHAKVCVVYMQPFYGQGSGNTGHTPAEPMPTVTARDRFAAVSLETTPHWVFPSKVFNRVRQVGRWAVKMLKKKVVDNLMWVVDEAGKKFPLLFVRVAGAIHLVTDIAMRMLQPRELARAQGFPDWYVIDRDVNGRRISKANQVKLIGNSVCPQLARAIAKANVVDLGVLRDAGMAVAS